jgi:PEGA domain-containing protein
MNKAILSGVLSVALVVSGCATIVHGTSQAIPFSSNPEGAEVFVNGSARGITPTTVTLPRSSSSYNVVYKKAGYEDTSDNLRSSISGYYFLNIILGGIVGLVLDAMDGAWFDYDDPNTVNLPQLEARANPATMGAPAKAGVEAEPQIASAPTASLEVAPKVVPAHHVKPDPDARALWIQQ